VQSISTIFVGLANPSDEFNVYYSERLPWCKYHCNMSVVSETDAYKLLILSPEAVLAGLYTNRSDLHVIINLNAGKSEIFIVIYCYRTTCQPV